MYYFTRTFLLSAILILVMATACSVYGEKEGSSVTENSISLKTHEGKGAKSVTLKVAGMEITNIKSVSAWGLRIGDEQYKLRPYPSVKMKSISITENTPLRKTLTMTSVPFTKKAVLLTQELTAVKDFPGLFFRIKRKNIGTEPVQGIIENYLSMKKSEYVTSTGKHPAGGPWTRKTGIKNWIYLPNKKNGLGIILNYSQADMSFISTFGKKGRDGKRVNDLSRSSWGIRRFLKIDPGQTKELLFALVAANSAEETARLCEKIQTDKLFPDLILEKYNNELVSPKGIASTSVEPITDPKQYSAEKTDAKTIDDWVKREIRPEQFDIWNGKKDRLYLNGSWKLLKLAGTKEKSDCAYGIDHGFQKTDFNDEKWFNQPVPFLWNVPFEGKDGGKVKRKIVFGGVGWYRKKFFVPKNDNGKRFILCFKAIDQEATVYVNGKEVAFHKTISVDPLWGVFSIQQDPFEIDVTDIIKTGAENTIAIRVYDDGYFKSTSTMFKKICSGIGGIWQELYLETRPRIYLQKAITTFDVEKSIMRIDAFVVNTNSELVKEKLFVELSQWESTRYSLAKGNPNKIDLGESELKPGLNRLKFMVPITNPQLWSPEQPYLYNMKIVNGKDTLLGQERIGLREIKIGDNYFYLNGKKITLRGQQALWSSWMGAPGFRILSYRMGLMNRRDAIEKWFDKYKKLNHNIVRNHSTFFPHSFYDIADEKGIMVYVGHYYEPNLPFFDNHGKMTDFYRGKLRKTAENIQLYPSIALFSQKNEDYDSKYIGRKIDGAKPYLNQIYSEFKKHASKIPVSSSGRPPTEASLNKTGTKPYAFAKSFANTDFYAVHNYKPSAYDVAFAEDDDWFFSLKKYRDSYVLDDGPKVMWNSETLISSIVPHVHSYSKTLDKQFRPHIHNDMIDRKWFVENWKLIPFTKYSSLLGLNRSVPKFGFLDTVLLDRSIHAQAEFVKRFTELHRRKRDYCAGYAGNSPQIFFGGQNNYEMDSIYNKPVAESIKKANQPVLSCLDYKWNRNIFSGENAATPVYVMNDHEGDISDVNVAISLKPLDQMGKDISLNAIAVGSLTPAEMKTIDYVFDIPNDIISGHYQVILQSNYSYKNKSSQSVNDYKTFILNRNDLKLNAIAKDTIALLSIPGTDIKQTAAMLESLKIPFSVVEDFKQLNKFKIAILPPDSPSGSSEIIKWVKAGGKLLSFSQKKVPEGLPQTIRATGRYGFFTELILKTHPVLNELEQSDFRYWNGARDKIINKWVVTQCLLPLNDGVIASLMTSGNRMGMSIAEYRIGKGICLLSQVEAVQRFNTDSVATRYLLNTLNYCLKGWEAPGAPLLQAAEKKIAAFNLDSKKTFSIDISKQCTMGFTDAKAGDKQGGWTDQGPGLDLHNLPTGKQVFNGVPFDIIKPENNNGKSCIVLRGSLSTKTEFLPLKKRIELNCKAQKLYFLISAAWLNPQSKNAIASLKISEEADGTAMSSFFQVDLLPGKNISDWWNAAANKPSEVELGWVGLTGQNLKTYEVGTYILEWTNPNPGKIIQYIEFESTETAVPAILAITGIEK